MRPVEQFFVCSHRSNFHFYKYNVKCTVMKKKRKYFYCDKFIINDVVKSFDFTNLN